MGIDVNRSVLPEGAEAMVSQLSELYKWNWVLLIPFLIIIAGAIVKKPPVPTMIISAFIAIIIGIAYQGFDLTAGFTSAIDGFKVSMLTDNEVLPSITTLLNRGGMKSMVGIIVMLFAGYSYAGIIARGKLLEIVLEPFMKKINTEPKLVFATLITSFLVLCCAGITYVAFILTADMYKKAYYKLNLQPRVLSRVMEDAATCMAPLVPWGTSGLFYVSVLGVSVYGAAGYAPYAFLTFLSPIVSFLISIFGIGMFKMSNEQRKAVGERLGIIDSGETLIAEQQ
jgi:NhaC family Na+:H+ antiporter